MITVVDSYYAFRISQNVTITIGHRYFIMWWYFYLKQTAEILSTLIAKMRAQPQHNIQNVHVWPWIITVIRDVNTWWEFLFNCDVSCSAKQLELHSSCTKIVASKFLYVLQKANLYATQTTFFWWILRDVANPHFL